jgi:hypothetical protein
MITGAIVEPKRVASPRPKHKRKPLNARKEYHGVAMKAPALQRHQIVRRSSKDEPFPVNVLEHTAGSIRGQLVITVAPVDCGKGSTRDQSYEVKMTTSRER